MLRVLYCTDFLMSGGVERHVADLATGLDRSRFSPQVICLYGERAGRSLQFLPHLQAAHVPVEVFDLGWGFIDKLRGLISIIRATWQFRPHIFHALNYHSNMLARLARPFMPLNVKLLGVQQTGALTPKQLLYERLSWWLCARIVAVSPALKQLLIEQAGIPARKMECIFNGVDVEKFAKIPVSNLRGELAPEAKRVFVSLGRIAPEKAPELLAQAVSVLRSQNQLPDDVRFLLFGEQLYPKTQAEIDAIVEKNGLRTVFRQFPSTPHPEAVYHAADVTVLPSLYEGMSHVALESLAARKPVIISEAANAAGVIEHGVTGWVFRTRDAAHLAETFSTVIALPDDEFKVMGDRCFTRVQDFAVPRMVANYEALYESL